MTTNINEVRSFNRPSAALETSRERRDSLQQPRTESELDDKRETLMVAGLLEVFVGFGATADEITKALELAIMLAPKRTELVCYDCHRLFGRLPGVTPKRCASCADLRRREMDNIDKRNVVPKAPAKPRLRRNGLFVSREQIESVTTNTKTPTLVTSDKPCPACGRQPPRGRSFCNQACYRIVMKRGRF
jgi:hypothetical protein